MEKKPRTVRRVILKIRERKAKSFDCTLEKEYDGPRQGVDVTLGGYGSPGHAIWKLAGNMIELAITDNQNIETDEQIELLVNLNGKQLTDEEIAIMIAEETTETPWAMFGAYCFHYSNIRPYRAMVSLIVLDDPPRGPTLLSEEYKKTNIQLEAF